MKPTDLKGKVLTALGLVDPSSIGLTLTHEHLIIDFTCAFHEPEVLAPLTDLKGLGRLRQTPYSHKQNIILNKAEEVEEELEHFKRAAHHLAQTIYQENDVRRVCKPCLTDVTTIGIREISIDPSDQTRENLLREVSKRCDLHVICGAGYYISATHPKYLIDMTIDDIASTIEAEILSGIGDTKLCCGVIGEIGCSWPLTETEIKVLKASAKAQIKLGAPLIIHPGRNSNAPIQIIQILKEAGADISRTVISHLDRTIKYENSVESASVIEKTIFEEKSTLELASTGCILEYDLFGTEVSHYQFNDKIDMPSDAQRIDCIKMLIKNGYVKQILLSHDIHTKHRLVKYGGHGFGHLFENVVPKMLERGINKEDIITMLVENPKRWLTFKLSLIHI
eukprot:TRINITY_DN800_c0_g1_i1.p1 TRINITY_DN800_c0_g1~~TRINITY_DN800_c0_g1_i1.p1  ORF type:complete len:394 (-),score=62.20 TRINITY_DN800_c0_g1_i1:24-1205(-)